MDKTSLNTSNLIEDGFIILRNILTKDEIQTLRAVLNNYFISHGVQMFGGISQPNAAVLLPSLDWIFSHPKIINALKNLFPDKKLMFTSHCDIHSGIIAGWHKDDGTSSSKNSLGYFDCLTYNIEECNVYKVAIYLQDHEHNFSGFKVKRGSHRFSSNEEGEEIYLKTNIGDVIIFDVRLTHSGQSDIIPIPWLKKPINFIRKMFSYSPILDNKIKSTYELFFGTKMSIFFTFGYPNDWTVVFAKNNMKRQVEQNQDSQVLLPCNTRKKLVEQNVLLAEDHFADFIKS